MVVVAGCRPLRVYMCCASETLPHTLFQASLPCPLSPSPVVCDGHHGALEVGQEALQPGHALRIQVVGGLRVWVCGWVWVCVGVGGWVGGWVGRGRGGWVWVVGVGVGVSEGGCGWVWVAEGEGLKVA
jgi:hypothetical protein